MKCQELRRWALKCYRALVSKYGRTDINRISLNCHQSPNNSEEPTSASGHSCCDVADSWQSKQQHTFESISDSLIARVPPRINAQLEVHFAKSDQIALATPGARYHKSRDRARRQKGWSLRRAVMFEVFWKSGLTARLSEVDSGGPPDWKEVYRIYYATGDKPNGKKQRVPHQHSN